MINLLIRTNHWPKQRAIDQAYLQHFKVALANLEMNMQEDRFWRKAPHSLRKK